MVKNHDLNRLLPKAEALAASCTKPHEAKALYDRTPHGSDLRAIYKARYIELAIAKANNMVKSNLTLLEAEALYCKAEGIPEVVRIYEAKWMELAVPAFKDMLNLNSCATASSAIHLFHNLISHLNQVKVMSRSYLEGSFERQRAKEALNDQDQIALDACTTSDDARELYLKAPCSSMLELQAKTLLEKLVLKEAKDKACSCVTANEAKDLYKKARTGSPEACIYRGRFQIMAENEARNNLASCTRVDEIRDLYQRSKKGSLAGKLLAKKLREFNL